MNTTITPTGNILHTAPCGARARQNILEGVPFGLDQDGAEITVGSSYLSLKAAAVAAGCEDPAQCATDTAQAIWHAENPRRAPITRR